MTVDTPGYDPSGPVPRYPRKAHRKSRTGCATCKSRKVKCDERHPACLNCITHGVKCPFLTVKQSTSASTRPSGGTRVAKPRSPTYISPISPTTSAPLSVPSTTPPPASAPEQDDLPLLELELLHNFTTQTYSTLAADAGVCDFWRVNVVQIGLQCDYIMRAILAISALHLAYHRPSRRDFWTAQGIVFHQRAARSAVRFIAPSGVHNLDDAVNLFVFSMLTIYFALASPRHSLADGSFFIGGASSPSLPDWTFLLNGAKSFSHILGSQGHDTVLAPFLAYGHVRYHAARDTPRPSTSLSGVAALRERILAASPAPSQDVLATYAHALDELELALVARQSEEMPRDVLDAMLWLWEVSDSLVPLLKSGTGEGGSPSGKPAQEAVAIFAHFSILLRHHESHWWLQGWAEHLISQAWEILDEEHRSWIEWPMREIGWTPPGARES
ncbi:hypothetical protein B0T16DRAFT_326522 [Cercophora newfieldiana]|uniref:Zn(2)-C6 fungal-type domain-containing protein n=1 Tax=Cercophora newfieldiana TaxID=92897 RepID=A0AA39Y9J5_9PEZI|nr:hypothetical protein B0T16DRAFT_326522 [Cercophora newfieldiana]